MTQSFATLLDRSVKAHGHLCPGQVLGVRMGMLGLALLGLEAPLNDRDIKKVIIYVEIDRCATDALSSSTGVKLGRRSLKFMDYGLMAATFVHLPDGRAYRVAVREDCRYKAALAAPQIMDPRLREIEAYQVLPAADLFIVDEVTVDLRPEDLPGAHSNKTVCDECGTMIRHKRELIVSGRSLCAVCAGQGYFQKVSTVERVDSFDPVRQARSYVEPSAQLKEEQV